MKLTALSARFLPVSFMINGPGRPPGAVIKEFAGWGREVSQKP
ncbi:hypothetical protein [Micromonospora aurantiaca (nom. illeg.)]